MTTTIIDTATRVTSTAQSLFDEGVRVVIRYYTSSLTSSKLLWPDEVQSIARAGLELATVYQVAQNSRDNFDEKKGGAAGKAAGKYAMEVIGQPAGSAIYFAVDYDATTSDINTYISPYFQAVRSQLVEGNPAQGYRVGVYGSGRVCQMLLDRGLADLAWLAGSTGWGGYGDFKASQRWALLQHTSTTIAGVSVDPDDARPGLTDFGQFKPSTASGVAPCKVVGKYRVTATALNVRSAPASDAEKLGSLPKGTIVDVLGFAGDAYGWAAVSTTGGSGHGYSSMKYLAPVA